MKGDSKGRGDKMRRRWMGRGGDVFDRDGGMWGHTATSQCFATKTEAILNRCEESDGSQSESGAVRQES